MKAIVLSASLLIALPIAAQTAAKPPQDAPKTPPAAQPSPNPAPAAPVISDALKAQFFKAQSMKLQADTQADRMGAVFQEAVANMQKACGNTYLLQLDRSGDPVCIATPSTPEKK
jgi:hypothetical protein